jgi:hypothetical protein
VSVTVPRPRELRRRTAHNLPVARERSTGKQHLLALARHRLMTENGDAGAANTSKAPIATTSAASFRMSVPPHDSNPSSRPPRPRGSRESSHPPLRCFLRKDEIGSRTPRFPRCHLARARSPRARRAVPERPGRSPTGSASPTCSAQDRLTRHEDGGTWCSLGARRALPLAATGLRNCTARARDENKPAVDLVEAQSDGTSQSRRSPSGEQRSRHQAT